jgi:hypothetical protein
VWADADTEETFQVVINAQSYMRTGDLCTAYAEIYGGTGPYDFTWSGDLWWGSNSGYSSYRQETLNDSGTYTQILEAWDENEDYAFHSRPGLVVGPNGNECFER